MNKISRSNVLSLQLARERARQPRGSSNGHVSKRGPLSNQRLLERLEAENAHSYEPVWWNSCSGFKHCAMMPEL